MRIEMGRFEIEGVGGCLLLLQRMHACVFLMGSDHFVSIASLSRGSESRADPLFCISSTNLLLKKDPFYVTNLASHN